ncbi:HAD family hydrolase [Mycetocola zhadangensis]|uniref:HAD family hydrolase n=1 Tax=Mycetocola zhadangensis TaxID=1164595 RepID=A0A3L7J2C3_9MICO|nr:HAD family hydrolase [Mycetocola zhadangensis]
MTSPELTSTGTVTRTWSCVLFDLDGTITDSAPGIVARLAKTFVALGLPVPSDDELLNWVGPPLLESLEVRAGMTAAEAFNALTVYRGISDIDGPWTGSAVYPGIAGVIKNLFAAGIPIAITSSKPESQVRAVLDHFDLSQYFTELCGASEDEVRSSKADVIQEALLRLTAKEIDLNQVVLVGDRHHDVEGAAVHGIPTIMVEWGYGSPVEAEHAMAVVHSTDQLSKLLLG